MNKEQPKQFAFLFPLMDTSAPYKLTTELQVIGCVDTGRLQENLGINILQINYAARGQRIASDIKDLLRFINADIYGDIVQAASNHATEKFGLRKHKVVTV